MSRLLPRILQQTLRVPAWSTWAGLFVPNYRDLTIELTKPANNKLRQQQQQKQQLTDSIKRNMKLSMNIISLLSLLVLPSTISAQSLRNRNLCSNAVTGFKLIDAKENMIYGPLPSNLNYVKLGFKDISIQAETTSCPSKPIRSVRMDVGHQSKCENTFPYTAFGDIISGHGDIDYFPQTPSQGTFDVKATIYTESDCRGHPGDSLTQTITIEEEQGETLTLTVLNEAFQQPFGAFFVMVHNDDALPLYHRGGPASHELAVLAEDGNPANLVDFYTKNNHGVFYVGSHSDGAPYFGGETTDIQVTVTEEYPYVTIASMAINTNDCFVAINGMQLSRGMVLDTPGLDAGTEENNEKCNSIPGPACAEIDTDNVRSGNGEGFIHIHRGFFGIGPDLSEVGYDWRNPMMRVTVN